jgi:hypothetical protein
MATWIDGYAEALGLEPLDKEEVGLLLDLARDVAHGSERRYAPLATFLAGYRAGREGGDRRASIEEAAAKATERLSAPGT